ncbi:MAG: hypothetical protein B7C24_03835 [Bacteroidetes bacterium 4572_77]|nr:MAG: hypothetical protein B7C24_03835 [Bacteroidetes bacterium 4572_77]
MIKRQEIEDLIAEQLEGTDQFLVELTINEANKIQVFLDSDSQLTITDCIKVSRQIESNLDREEDDFELNVSSAGLDLPLRKQRQYKKHLNKLMKIKTNNDETLLLRMDKVNDKSIEGIPLKKNKNAKKGAKKQFIELERVEIPFSSIIEGKIEVVF